MIRTVFRLEKYITRPYIECARNKSSKMDKSVMLQYIKSSIPPLDNKSHKGQAGRIGIVGGSLEYTGAPYFAGISALRVGADLSHVFCASSAATVIKSYSPELIVHPLLDQPNAVTKITPWFDRLHSIVIGPGLGREADTFKVVSGLITTIREKKISLIIDADGLFLITENVDLIKNFSSPVILTPNLIEFQRLCDKIGGQNNLKQLGENIIILKKGAIDEVLSTITEIEWKGDEGGSGRRCGGQGDLLSGSIAPFVYWISSNKDINIVANKGAAAASLACYAASILVKRCNEKGFKLKGRSMLASDMIEEIHEAFVELFGQ